ncbi:MAG: hypothetical protein EA414_00880 [Arthrospira sp. PLM2.Bin9]|nr:MAG: hypothetical protein EA414_00880 [Arthrospira sp. PLM2.Bin9]
MRSTTGCCWVPLGLHPTYGLLLGSAGASPNLRVVVGFRWGFTQPTGCCWVPLGLHPTYGLLLGSAGASPNLQIWI